MGPQGDRRLERPLLVDGRALGGQRADPFRADGAQFAWSTGRARSTSSTAARALRRPDPSARGSRGRPQAAAISPDGRTLVVADLGRLGFWDLRTRRALGEPQHAHAGDAPAVTFSADGRWLVTGGTDDILRVWTHAAARRATASSSPRRGGPEPERPGPLLAADAGRRTGVEGGLQLLSVPELEVVRQVPARGTVARFTPDGRP